MLALSRTFHATTDWTCVVSRCRTEFYMGNRLLVLYLPENRARAKYRAAGRDQVDLRLDCVINSSDFTGETIVKAISGAYAI